VLVTLGAALVALICVVASGRRLAWAVAPAGLDSRLLSEALGGDGGAAMWRSLRRELARHGGFRWERELFAAFDEPEGPARDALVNEQLLEFEARAERWLRVPRVCASIGTSTGLLFGSIALLQGLAVPAGDAANEAVQAALASALGSVSLGIAATSFCVAAHVRAGRTARRARAGVDALVERLRCVSDTDPCRT
jgi:hypothetical protein